MKRLKRYFITGLVLVFPFFLTLYILVSIFKFADGILGRFLNAYLKKTLGFYLPGLGFLISFILILIAGFFANKFIGKKIFTKIEKWFSGLPLINKLYPAFKQIISFMLQQKEFGFKKVVLVEYPSKDIWSIGFLTNEEFKTIAKISDKELVSVFVPTVPGPLTGNIIFVPKAEVKFLDISVSDALKIIVSGGILKPGG